MKRFFVAIIAVLALGSLFVLIAPNAGAHGNNTASIAGTVVNATHQNASVANQRVTLQRSTGSTAQDVASVVTGKDGHFSFSGVTASSSDTFAVYTQFQGGMFPSATFNVGNAAATALQLKVYDTTNDDSNLKVTVATLLVRQPRPVNGLIGVGAIATVENTGITAFVGTPTSAPGKPMRLLRFATPANASNLSLGIGFAGSQIFTTDRGFGSTATVLPGTTDFAYSIDIPYTGTAADLTYKSVYPVTRVVALVPTDMFVSAGDFQAQGLIDSLGTRYQLFSVANAAAGKSLGLQLTGLPLAGEKSNLDSTSLAIFAAILALLALLVVLLYLFRGSIGPALGLIPAQFPAADDKPDGPSGATVGAGDEEPERLLHDLIELERAHAANKVSEADFRKRDRTLRLRLRSLMSSEKVSGPVAVDGEVAVAADGVSAADGAARQVATAEEATSEQSSRGRR